MLAIHIENLWKEYRLGVISHDTLTQDLQSWWARIRGKDDPNSQIATAIPESKRIDRERLLALRGVNLSVEQGEVVGIIGRNGAGKSTLLKILSRVTAPSRGLVQTRGRLASLLEVGTGFHPELTGRENVFLNGAILGMTKKEISSKYDEIVEFAELREFIDTPVKRYSSGMYVRLAFAVAAHLDTEIMVVDEVLAVGDVVFQRKCLGKMKDVSGAGRTVLFVSHSMTAIKNLCSRVIWIDQGKVERDGDPDTVISAYLGRNLVKGAVVGRQEIAERIEGVIKRQTPYFNILEVCLEKAEGQAATTFQSTEQVVVAVRYQCHQRMNDLRVLVSVADENGRRIFGSQNTDDLKVAELFYQVEPGEYLVKCTFPPDLFGNRSYGITVDMFCPKKEHHVLSNILEFEVEFHGYNPEIQYGGNNLELFLWPRLSWSLSTLGRIN